MTSSEPGSGDAGGSRPEGSGETEPVDLNKNAAGGADEPTFDPYRFGRPEHPVPSEYAPPGYVPDPAPEAGRQAGPGNYPPPPHWGQPQHGQQQWGQQPWGQQHPPYPPAPYGQPGPPGYPPPPYGQPRRGNGKATTALVLGIGSIVFCWVFFFDYVLVVLAIVFGFVALAQARRTGGVGRGMAIAGIVCGVVGAVVATVLTVLFVGAANDCGGFDNARDPGFNSCVQDQFR